MMNDRTTIRLHVNGAEHEVSVPPRKLLSDVLREDCRLTGTHVGCEHGVCGACTVLVDGRPTRSCLCFAVQMPGHEITTIEAIASRGGVEASADAATGGPGRARASGAAGDVRLTPLQQALHEEHGLQCGFCTAGIVITFEAYLREHPDPSDEEIREVLAGNLCRCTGYHNIVAAVRKAAARMRAERGGEDVGR